MMHSNIEAPIGFFGETVDNNLSIPPLQGITTPEIVKPKPFTMSKFKFGKFNSSKAPATVVPTTPIPNSTVEIVEAKVEYPVYVGVKLPYNYNHSFTPMLEAKKNIANDFNTMMQQQSLNKSAKVDQAALEKKAGEEEAIDMFGETSAFVDEGIVENSRKNKLLQKVDDTVKRLDRNFFVSKQDSSIKNYLLPDAMFNELFVVFEYLTPEERGRLLINMIFGGLIPTAKLTGNGLKAAKSEFKGLTDAIEKLQGGGGNPDLGLIYTSTLNSIINNGSKYRIDMGSKDQVKLLANFVNKLARSNFPVYFPTNLLFTDPVPLPPPPKGESAKPAKSIPLNGKPTIDNITDFFGASREITQKAQAVLRTEQTKEINKNLLEKKRGFVGRSNDMEDLF